MLDMLLALWDLFRSVWVRLSPDQKRKVIDAMVDSLVSLLQASKSAMSAVGDNLRQHQQLIVDAAQERGERGPRSLTARAATVALQQECRDVPTTEAEKFGQTVDQFVLSQDFADLVNQAVPSPAPGESHEQFVARAKQAIRDVLQKRLKEMADVAGPNRRARQ
jgi:hypothetical protein